MIVYRGASQAEAKRIIRAKHGLPTKTGDLIATDWEVLEYGYPQTRMMNDSQRERYFNKIIPNWANKQGMNVTTDKMNAIGYAQSRNGKVLAFDISRATDIFEGSNTHLQIRYPRQAKLVAVYDKYGNLEREL